jgi:transposase
MERTDKNGHYIMGSSPECQMAKRKTFSREFKLEAIRQLEEGDKPASLVATELGIRRNMLYKWQEQMRQHGDVAFQGSGRKPVSQADEVTRLRKELEAVKMERDILKKAAAYFARELK